MSSLFIPLLFRLLLFFSLVSKLLSLPASGEAEGKKERVIERNLMSSYVGVPWGGWLLFAIRGGFGRACGPLLVWWLYLFCLMSSSIIAHPLDSLLILLRYPLFCGHSSLAPVARAEKCDVRCHHLLFIFLYRGSLGLGRWW